MGERSRQRWFEQVDLNDADAVQRALAEVIERVFQGNISYKKAAKILCKLGNTVARMHAAKARSHSTRSAPLPRSGQALRSAVAGAPVGMTESEFCHAERSAGRAQRA
jgi:hypothetical protein